MIRTGISDLPAEFFEPFEVWKKVETEGELILNQNNNRTLQFGWVTSEKCQ